MSMPNPTAVFDADGVCVAIAVHPGRRPPGGAKAEVAQGTRPRDVWWNGSAVMMSAPLAHEFPGVVAVGEAVRLELGDHTVADVNGVRQRGVLDIPTAEPGRVRIEVRGAQYASLSIEVRDYAAARKAEYPSLADQLDALWKGGAAEAGMRRRIANVKMRNPKPGVHK